MFLLLVSLASLASLLCRGGAGAASEKETTRGLLYLQRFGYLSARNQSAALSTAEGLQERKSSSFYISEQNIKIFLNIQIFFTNKIDEARVFRIISRLE